MNEYNQRTPAEIALINSYIDKWDKILYSTQPIDRVKAEQAVFNAYQYLGLPAPKIYFLTSPSPAEGERLRSIMPDEVGSFIRLKGDLEDKLLDDLKQEFSDDCALENLKIDCTDSFGLLDPFACYFDRLYGNIRGELFEKISTLSYSEYFWIVNERYNTNFCKMMESEIHRTNSSFFDLYIEQREEKLELLSWNILKFLNKECPYLVTWERACIIIERPCELSLDCLKWPHANGKAAIEYADGYQVYCYHGIKIPEKYGKIPIDDWQSQWILDEQKSPTSSSEYEQEQLGIALRFGIGSKKFYEQLPNNVDVYWKTNMDGHWENNRHPSFSDMMKYAYHEVIFEWMLIYYYSYYDYEGDDNIEFNYYSFDGLREFTIFCDSIGKSNHPLIPGLNPISGSGLFNDDRSEIYYPICLNNQRVFSTIYCKLPDREPFIYAECLTSWIVSIAHCYQEGAYYLSIDPATGAKKIDRDLDKVEQIFEKFNPQQIDRWREVWRS